MTRVLCLGEPLISLTPDAAIATCESVHLGMGGAELNVAVHLARLGLDVGYAGAVGRDPFGERLRLALATEGVDCRGLVDGDGPTGVYFKEPGPPTRMLYYRAGSAGSRVEAVAADGADLVHVSGISLALDGAIAEAVRALLTWPRTWRVSFDVNYRPPLWDPADAGPALLRAAGAADIVFVGRDEAEIVWGLTGSGEIRDLIGTDAELVIKDGALDVEVWADGRWWRTQPPPVEVIEPVGAGDAFAAAYLATRIRGGDPDQAATRGHRLAAHVVASVTDQGNGDPELYAALAAVIGRSAVLSEEDAGGP